MLISTIGRSQTSFNCANLCVLNISNYDTITGEVDVTIYNADTNFINYPSVRLINTLGDTVGNISNLYFFFGHVPGDTLTHTIPTTLDSIPTGFTCTVLVEDNSSLDICSYAYPMSCTVGVPEISGSNFSLYPNPCSEFINFNFRSPEGTKTLISLYDTNGRLVKEFTSYEKTYIYQLESDIPDGMYYVSCYSNKHRTVKKLLISRK